MAISISNTLLKFKCHSLPAKWPAMRLFGRHFKFITSLHILCAANPHSLHLYAWRRGPHSCWNIMIMILKVEKKNTTIDFEQLIVSKIVYHRCELYIFRCSFLTLNVVLVSLTLIVAAFCLLGGSKIWPTHPSLRGGRKILGPTKGVEIRGASVELNQSEDECQRGRRSFFFFCLSTFHASFYFL